MIGLTPRRTGPARPELMEVLESCHARMRRFLGVAAQLSGAAAETPAAEIADAAGSVRRYFAVAYPLHGVDEETSLLPRLRGADASLDAALERIERDHAELDRDVHALVAVCERLEREPAALASVRDALAAATTTLTTRLTAHLELEESVFFPAIEARLVPSHSAEILAEIRARRT